MNENTRVVLVVFFCSVILKICIYPMKKILENKEFSFK